MVVNVGRHFLVLNTEPDILFVRGLADSYTAIAMLDTDPPGVFIDRPAVSFLEAAYRGHIQDFMDVFRGIERTRRAKATGHEGTCQGNDEPCYQGVLA